MLVPNRHANSSNYRYGFNGMESDNEIKGEGNSYDFGARMYDPRVGRFFTIDPLDHMFPDQSPYSFAYNNPLLFIDPDGESPRIIFKALWRLLYGRAVVTGGVAALEVNAGIGAFHREGIASGIAVDRHGNVGLFLSRSQGVTTTASVGVGAKYTDLFYESVTDIRGKGSSLTGEISGEPLGIPVDVGASAEFNANFRLVGYGLQITFGIGLPTPTSLTAEVSDTRMLAMSGNTFDKFIEKYADAYKIVNNRIYEHSKVATGKANGDGFIRQIKTDKRHIEFFEREGGMYEMFIGLDVRIIPNSSAPKGAREVQYREYVPTGLMFEMDKDGDMIDSKGVKTGF